MLRVANEDCRVEAFKAMMCFCQLNISLLYSPRTDVFTLLCVIIVISVVKKYQNLIKINRIIHKNATFVYFHTFRGSLSFAALSLFCKN